MKASIKQLFLQFLCTLFVLGLVPTLYFTTEFKRVKTQYDTNIKHASQNQIQYSFHELGVIIDEISASIPSIATSRTLQRTLNNPTQDNIESVEDLWVMLARGQKYYSQLRLLDLQGNETIRINYDGDTERVPSSKLQNKSSRDYFKQLQNLTIGEIATAGIDLEVENGSLVKPLVPALRIMTPIAVDNKIVSYFIANLNMKEIYQRLQYQIGDQGASPVVLNRHGYTLIDQDLSQAFGHLFEKNSQHTYAITHPKLWTKIQENHTGTYFDKEGWYFYSDISKEVQQLEGPIYMVLHIMNSELNTQFIAQQKALIVQGTTLGLLISFIALGFVIWNHNHRKNSIESQLAKAAMNGMSALVITNRNNHIIKVNQAFTKMSGYTLEEVKGKSPAMFASGKYNQEFYINMWSVIQKRGLWEGEVVNRRKDGSLITEILRIQTIKDTKGVILFYVASFVDISKHKELENKLRDLSEKDGLADCWNRRKFDQELRNECTRVARYPDNEESCLAILDIDHFKRINDEFGHDYGDKVIQTVAKVLQRECRETDFVARIGGEEFGIILPHTSLNEAFSVMNRLRIAVCLELDSRVTISGGITNLTDDTKLNYKCADMALYEAKASGRDTICQFLDTEMCEIA